MAALTYTSHELTHVLARVEEAQAEEERAETETCLRRGRLAEEIGDAESAAVAREIADKNRRHHEHLLDKVGTLEEERADHPATA